MNIDIKKIENIKQDLDELKENQALFIDENGQTKYAIVPVQTYDDYEEALSVMNELKELNENSTQVKIVGVDSQEVTYEEYERIKTTVMEAIEKTFKPKAEKMN